MNALEEAKAVLNDAEQNLRMILRRAAEEGEYAHLQQVAGWAKLLNASLAGAISPTPDVVASALANPPRKRATEAVDKAIERQPLARKKKKRIAKTKKRRSSKKGYPQFLRTGDSVVKIGWSKRDGKPYEHKAPKSVLHSLIKAVVRAGSGGEVFMIESLLPLNDTSGAQIPDYQAYLTLAWLRSIQLITQHGRQGYSIPLGIDLADESAKRWDELTSR